MDQTGILALGILIPFCGTAIGSAFVFLCKHTPGERWGKALAGFAAGVMLAASVWSLLLPAIALASENGRVPAFLPATLGFAAGALLLLPTDVPLPAFRIRGKEKTRLSLPMLAVTLHNLPEGMAVGVILVGFASEQAAVTAAGALSLSVGIALQNIPEGAIISMPLLSEGGSRGRAFLWGVLSGAVEPIGALLTLVLAKSVTPALPYILSFAAGAMVCVAVGELIPEARSAGRIGTVATAAGFGLMMLLDVALG